MNAYKQRMCANDMKTNHVTHPGEIIKDELTYLGISQKQFAAQIGVSPTLVNLIVKGKRPINLEFSLLTEAAINLPHDMLLNMQRRYDEFILENKTSFWQKLKGIKPVAASL